jgi:hypothetical protein
MEYYVLINTDDNSYCQLDSCYAKSFNSALIEFSMRGWVIGEVMTLWDYQSMLQNESELNSFESNIGLEQS